MNHASFLLNELGNIQNVLSDILVQAYDGNIHPTLISQYQLQNELINIRSYLPNNKKLPQEPTLENVIFYYKYIRTKARVYNGKIIIEMKIPLLYKLPVLYLYQSLLEMRWRTLNHHQLFTWYRWTGLYPTP